MGNIEQGSNMICLGFNNIAVTLPAVSKLENELVDGCEREKWGQLGW